MTTLLDRPKKFALALIIVIFLSACGTAEEPTATVTTATQIPPTRTPFPPSPTPLPIAAIVNGEQITMAEFQAELARYKASINRDLKSEDKRHVIRNLIQLTLLAQGARSQGYQVSEELLQERLSNLDSQDQPLDDWLAHHGYTEESFQESLARSIAAAWMRDTIIERAPQEAEQVHAQQILLYEQEQAEAVLNEIQDGTDFAQLARDYDPQTHGDLGWFPRGYLTMPGLDEVIFNLETGEISDMIETEIGFHIIKVLERDESRPLDLDVRHVLQKQALHDWLERQWNSSTISISISD